MSYFLTRVMLISVIIGTLAGASSAVAQNYDIAMRKVLSELLLSQVVANVESLNRITQSPE
jgi:hypothetical protein